MGPVSKTMLYVGLGVLIGLVANSTIAGFADPILSKVKLSVALAA